MTQLTRLIAVITAAIVGAIVVAGWAAQRPERYATTTVVAIGPSPTILDDADLVDVVGGLDRGTIVETLAGLASSSSVTAAAAETAGIGPESIGDYDVDSVRAVASNLVDVTATGPDPAVAAALSAASAQVAADRFTALYRVYRVDIVTAAEVPATSDRPSTLLLAVGGGTVSAIAVAIVIAAAESRRRDRHLAAVGARPRGERLAS